MKINEKVKLRRDSKHIFPHLNCEKIYTIIAIKQIPNINHRLGCQYDYADDGGCYCTAQGTIGYIKLAQDKKKESYHAYHFDTV